VYVNRHALPHAWRVTHASQADWPTIRARLAGAGTWDPATEALLEAPPGPERLAAGPVTAAAPSMNRLQLTTEGDGPGLVVVSENYDAGWRAFAAGRELPVQPADGLAMAVSVPAGRQVVSMVYEPRLWRAGLGCAALAGLVLGGWALWRRRKGAQALGMLSQG
jgi:hypothetical protein